MAFYPHTTPVMTQLADLDPLGKQGFIQTPVAWFHHLRRPDGRPDMLAIAFLGEILFRYRIVEGADPKSGTLVQGKSFKANCWQASMDYFSVRFCVSRKVAAETIRRLLVDYGVIRRELRTIRSAGRVLNNVQFIEPIPERLAEIAERPHHAEEEADDE